MSTTTATKITKADLITRLVNAGGYGSARHLRDKKHAELTEMVEALAASMEQPEETEYVTPGAPDIAPTALYTVAEVAEMVGLTKFAVRRWVRLGYLANTEAVQSSRKGQFHVLGADLASFLKDREERKITA